MPAKLLDAKTLYIDNHFSAAALDDATDEFRKWGRFQLVSGSQLADLTLVLSGDMENGATRFKFIDKDGDVVWSDARYWGRWKSATREMIRDLRKRLH